MNVDVKRGAVSDLVRCGLVHVIFCRSILMLFISDNGCGQELNPLHDLNAQTDCATRANSAAEVTLSTQVQHAEIV